MHHLKDGVGVDPDLHTSQLPVNATFFARKFPDVITDIEPFDVVNILAVLEHVPPEEQKLLAEKIYKYLKPKRLLLITVPALVVDII